MKQRKYFRKIPGASVYLSPMNPEDFEIYTAWINDLGISLGLGSSTANFALPNEKELLEKLASQGHNYAIVSSGDDTLVGNCSLFDIDHLNRKAEMGIFIGDRSNHNKGYGKEAVMLLLSYGFKFLNLNNIMLKVFSFNENALALYTKCGFREIGRRRKSFLTNGKYYDEIFMDILIEDFQSDFLEDKLP